MWHPYGDLTRNWSALDRDCAANTCHDIEWDDRRWNGCASSSLSRSTAPPSHSPDVDGESRSSSVTRSGFRTRSKDGSLASSDRRLGGTCDDLSASAHSAPSHADRNRIERTNLLGGTPSTARSRFRQSRLPHTCDNQRRRSGSFATGSPWTKPVGSRATPAMETGAAIQKLRVAQYHEPSGVRHGHTNLW